MRVHGFWSMPALPSTQTSLEDSSDLHESHEAFKDHVSSLQFCIACWKFGHLVSRAFCIVPEES